MQATNNTFGELMGGSKQFVIPVFQRDYAWGEKQWDRLWDDIAHTQSTGVGHFVGAIVKIPDRTVGATHSYLIIDGQQRLTTLTVLCVAIRDHVKEQGLQGSQTLLNPDQVESLCIKNPYESGDLVYKMRLRSSDDEILRAVIDGRSIDFLRGRQSPRIGDAYNHFRNRLKESTTDLTSIYHGANNLRIVDISLDRGVDDPQGVFESLNSTGVELTPGDLIRNYLLMGLAEAEQTRLYEQYWHLTEVLFRGRNGRTDNSALNFFLRDYLALKQRSTREDRPNQLYDSFKGYWEAIANHTSLEELLSDMLRFASFHATWSGHQQMSPQRLNEAMRNLRARGNTTGVLAMRLYDCYENGTLSEGHFRQSLKLLESYLLRHAVSGNQIRSFWRIFAEMTREIDDESPYESLLSTLLRPRGSSGFWSFQSDDVFAKNLQEKNLYALRICKSILDRLENDGEKESSPVGEYTVEHIMPQTLTSEWEEMLGENAVQVHNEWLHRLGNLTMTGYNSSYSNLPFDEKKTIPKGFNESAVRLNMYVRNQSEWAVEQMVERGKQLTERALKIWPSP